jgi:hypothetical protein
VALFTKTVQGYQTGKIPDSDVSDLIEKIPNFTAEPHLRFSGKTDESEQETDELESAPEDDNERIFDMWMACYTQQEIAAALNVTQPTVGNFIKFADPSKFYKNSDSDDDSEDDDTPNSSKGGKSRSRVERGIVPVIPWEIPKIGIL